jgi:hypothetical protein
MHWTRTSLENQSGVESVISWKCEKSFREFLKYFNATNFIWSWTNIIVGGGGLDDRKAHDEAEVTFIARLG